MPGSTLLLLTASPGDADALAEVLAAHAPGATSRSLGAAFLDGTSHGTALAGQPLYDALLTLPASEQDKTAELAKFIAGAGEFLDHRRSAAVVGQERLCLPGSGPIQVVMAWRRCLTMTMQEAQAWWHDRHGALVRARGSRLGYRQLHADPVASQELCRRLGFGADPYDGAVLTHGDGLEAQAAIFAHPYVAGAALADERNFIDHGRSALQAFLPFGRTR